MDAVIFFIKITLVILTLYVVFRYIVMYMYKNNVIRQLQCQLDEAHDEVERCEGDYLAFKRRYENLGSKTRKLKEKMNGLNELLLEAKPYIIDKEFKEKLDNYIINEMK